MHITSGRLVFFNAQWGMLLDPLSAVMLGVVTGVGFLIHVYSSGYMAHEGGYYRFFGYLNLFMFSMLILVLANNLLLLFVGWEGVGLCSYLLIGFYFLRKSASDAGKKAFIVNRIGDAGFVLGLVSSAEHHRHPAVHGNELGDRRRRIRGGQRRDDRDRAAAVRGRHRQIGADSAVRLAAGRHGRAHAGERADSRRHHGHRRRVHDHAHESGLPTGPGCPGRHRHHRRGDGDLRGEHGPGAERHQARAGVLHGQPVGLHVSGAGRGRLRRGNFPPDDPRLLQGPALPRFRQRDSRHGRRAGHAQDGRAVEQDSEHLLDVPGGHDRHFGNSAAGRIRQQGRHSGGFVQCAAGALGHRVRHRRVDGVLYVPAGIPDVFRRVARAARGRAPHSRIALGDDGAADDFGAALGGGRMDWLAGIAGRRAITSRNSWTR